MVPEKVAVTVNGVVITGLLAYAGWQHGPRVVLDFLGYAVAVGCLLGIAIWLLVELARRLDRVGAVGGEIDVDERDVLHIYRKGVLGKRALSRRVELDQVRAVTWNVIPTSPRAPVMVEFWGRDPELVFDLSGLRPCDHRLRPLGRVSIGILQACPERSRSVGRILTQRAVPCTIDLETLALRKVQVVLPRLSASAE
ncbi:MAG: hypothetical protein L0H78_19065 [Humibacillus sp.]|nr:hypothetical protein [Humibacillus sp.]